ncbi:MAG: UvrD-helicase domain-containing protein, partial [Candidatus Sericytochromatia bacterium]
TEKLQRDGLAALAFHGQMERLAKLANMEAFMQGQAEVMVATSAFGMGVDKDNVEMVLHYEISDSLEDYLQEAGRAGRKEDIQADCCILFDENDLERHFQLLNRQRLNQKEINQVWAALKKLKVLQFSRSTLEIAREAGWDLEHQHLETRVKSALAALEEAGLIERHQNDTLVLAGYFATCPVAEANQAIDTSLLLESEAERTTAKRVFQYLLSRASTQDRQDLAFDWMCEHLGLELDAAHKALNTLRQEGLIHSQIRQHVTLFTVKKREASRACFEALAALERRLLELLDYRSVSDLPYTMPLSLKEVNHLFKQEGIPSSLEDLRQILRYAWEPAYVSRKRYSRKREEFLLSFHKPCEQWRESVERRLNRGQRLLDFLEGLKPETDLPTIPGARTVAFALPDLKAALESQLFDTEPISLHHCDQLLLQLHKLRVIQAEDGVALYYTRMRLTRPEDTAGRRFTKAHYQRLNTFYSHKIQQIHLVGEYARRMLQNPAEARAFAADYFQMEFKAFLKRYFKQPQEREVLDRPMTQKRWEHVFGALSPVQLAIIQDHEHQRILVAAGPGSGKTRILVHKVAALLLQEDVKPEQFLMLTFSRPAAQEVRSRLLELLGTVAWRLDIATFHAYAFQLLEQPGEQENLKGIVAQATQAIEAEELPNRARIESKSVILVDEYQDISEQEYAFLRAILNVASESDPPRVIVVGDDDQNIYEFRGSSSRFMKDFARDFESHTYYLETNFRSAPNLVAFSNRFARRLSERIKADIELVAHRQDAGELSITRYAQPEFYLPMVAQIASRFRATAGSAKVSTAVLCATNDEALMLETLLKQQGLPARLLMQLDHFQLRNLLELQ